MFEFDQLFGQKPSDIKETCILTPFLLKGLAEKLQINKIFQGNPYSSGNNNKQTLICTRHGTHYAGDAVLFLKNTPCRKIIFFGACGSTHTNKNLDLGQLIMPKKCFAMDSFSRLLNDEKKDFPIYSATIDLSKYSNLKQCPLIPKTTHASMGSILLEKSYKKFFDNNLIQTIDVECAAILQAARHIKRLALAILYVTDILDIHNPYRRFSSSEKEKFKAALNQAVTMFEIIE